MIEGCRIHEKPPAELYDLLYDINTLDFDIKNLIRRIDEGSATRSHLEYIVKKIEDFWEKLEYRYID